MSEKITIIGAGIGGLSTALFLKQNGLEYQIYESAPEIKAVGAGIIIAINAMQVFQRLGIQEKIEKAGNPISSMNITDNQLNLLSAVNLKEYEKKYGVTNVAIHRGELQKILIDEVGIENINLSKKLIDIQRKDLFHLSFEDHSTLESKIIIGADGINSVVRNKLFEKSTLRNANQICWRGVCEYELPQKYSNELNEAWGKGNRFGFVPISAKKVYWFALTNAKDVENTEINLIDLFKDFHSDILNIISSTSKDNIFQSHIVDLKPIDKWQSKNLCIIGDAAHAITPNLGQGACQAVEDAYVIGELLNKKFSIEDTFFRYQELRKKKVDRLSKASWKFGKVAQWKNPFAVQLRNNILRLASKNMKQSQMKEIFELP